MSFGDPDFTAARRATAREDATLLELDLDGCRLHYGAGACTAGRAREGELAGVMDTAIELDSGASAEDHTYTGMTLRIASGGAAGQERRIAAYDGATRTATVAAPFDPSPAGADLFAVIDRPHACYRTCHTCQDRSNYSRGTVTHRFALAGAVVIPGPVPSARDPEDPVPEEILARPYLMEVDQAAAHADVEKGLSSRGSSTARLRDEPCEDLDDPYRESRLTPAGGTWWLRLIARSPNHEGRPARIRRGWRRLLDPGTASGPGVPHWTDEHYQIDRIDGPDATGEVRVILKDVIRFADRIRVPETSPGRLQADWPRAVQEGQAQDGGAASITLSEEASESYGEYRGFHVVITSGPGQGEERLITSYNGALRRASVASPWSIQPTSASTYLVTRLSFRVGAVRDEGKVQTASAGTIQLRPQASSADHAYTGLPVVITSGTGAGQERRITAYEGATRTATVEPDWDETPDTSSGYRVDEGTGAAYDLHGYPCEVRLGEQIVRVASRLGDEMTLASFHDRGIAGTSPADAREKDLVQLVRVYGPCGWKELVQTILNEGGIGDEWIDLDGLDHEEAAWFWGESFTLRVATPTAPSELLAELAKQSGSVIWFDPVEQRVRVRAVLPVLEPEVRQLTSAGHLIDGSVEVETIGTRRITRAAVWYDIRNPLTSRPEPKDFARARLVIDADAERPEHYGDVRDHAVFARWLDGTNDLIAAAIARRVVRYRRDPVRRVRFDTDPKDWDSRTGGVVRLVTPLIPGPDGQPYPWRAFIVRQEASGEKIRCEGETVNWDLRPAFIAPDDTPDYPDDTVYCHVAPDTGEFAAAGNPATADAYRII